MKKLIALFTLLTLTAVYAEGDQKEHFEKRKGEMLSHIDAQISALNETKSCISSASNQEAIKACREAAEKKREALHAKQKEMHAKQIDEQIKKLQERKAKMSEKGEKK